MVKYATFGVVQEFDYAVQVRQEAMQSSSPQQTQEGELEGRAVTSYCCQMIPPHILEKLKNSDHHHLEDIKERLQAKAHLHTEARERRHAAATAPAKQLKAINYTIIDANGNEEFNDDRVVTDVSTNETAGRLLLWAQRTMDFLKNQYGWNGIDNNNMAVRAYFNYGERYDNAFWDGQQFFCGTGDGLIFDDFSKYLDVVGHELNHGVNQFKNQLVYRKQNGALDESFADIAGVLIKHLFLLSQNPRLQMSQLNGKIGEGLILPNNRNQYALRDMDTGVGFRDHPELGTDFQPLRMSDLVKTKEDNGGVHTNSGIPNKLFWEIYTHPKFADTPLRRIAKVSQLLWTARKTLNSSSTFTTWGSLLLDAATKLYGKKSTEVSVVTYALKITEIRK